MSDFNLSTEKFLAGLTPASFSIGGCFGYPQAIPGSDFERHLNKSSEPTPPARPRDGSPASDSRSEVDEPRSAEQAQSAEDAKQEKTISDHANTTDDVTGAEASATTQNAANEDGEVAAEPEAGVGVAAEKGGKEQAAAVTALQEQGDANGDADKASSQLAATADDEAAVGTKSGEGKDDVATTAQTGVVDKEPGKETAGAGKTSPQHQQANEASLQAAANEKAKQSQDGDEDSHSVAGDANPTKPVSKKAIARESKTVQSSATDQKTEQLDSANTPVAAAVAAGQDSVEKAGQDKKPNEAKSKPGDKVAATPKPGQAAPISASQVNSEQGETVPANVVSLEVEATDAAIAADSSTTSKTTPVNSSGAKADSAVPPVTVGSGNGAKSTEGAPDARTAEKAVGSLTKSETSRFINRVAKAFDFAQERGGVLKLRLSPPELGSLRLEITLKDGAVVARIETETTAAKTALLDNLAQLRERLAEQNIRIESFDIDVNDQPGSQQGTAGQQDEQTKNSSGAGNAGGTTPTTANEDEQEQATPGKSASHPNSELDLVA